MPATPTNGELRDRDAAAALFRYLSELVGLRTTHVRDANSYQSVLWFDEIPRELECATAAWGELEDSADIPWLRIDKPHKPIRSNVPEPIRPWVSEHVLNDTAREPSLQLQIQVGRANDDPNEFAPQATEAIRLTDHPEISELWREYLILQWLPWQRAMQRYERVQRVYRLLFQMYQELQGGSEQLELVMGIGTLVWRDGSDHTIRRPIIVGRVSLTLDAETGQLVLSPSAEGVDFTLESDFLEPEQRPPPTAIVAIDQEVATFESPWERARAFSVLRGWLNRLPQATDAQFQECLAAPQNVQHYPQMAYAPVLILRKRVVHPLRDALRKASELVLENRPLPLGLAHIFSPGPPEVIPAANLVGDHSRNEAEPVLFPLHSNEEQLRIVERLGHSPAVLVQGPPGTGKSHTIVNLLCHLLAAGKRVLVTSQTPQALRVLQEMLPKDIRPLAVSVLGSDPTSRRNLENSVHGILHGVNNTSVEALDARINGLSHERIVCQGELARLIQRASDLRASEASHKTVAGASFSGTPQELAKQIAAEADQYSWFVDSIAEDDLCPLDNEEFEECCEIMGEFGSELGTAAHQLLPPLESIVPVGEFSDAVSRYTAAHATLASLAGNGENQHVSRLQERSESELRAIYQLCKEFLSTLTDVARTKTSWSEGAIQNVLAGQEARWRVLHATTVAAIQTSGANSVESSGVDEEQLPELNGRPLPDILADVKRLLDHIRRGKGFGIWPFRPSVVRHTAYLWHDLRWRGNRLDNEAYLAEFVGALQIQLQTNAACREWEAHAPLPDGSLPFRVAILSEREHLLRKVFHLGQLTATVRAWFTAWDWPTTLLEDSAWASVLAQNVVIAEARNDHLAKKSCLLELVGRMRGLRIAGQADTRLEALIAAMQQGQVASYRQAVEALREACNRRTRAARGFDLLQRLQERAPQLASALRSTETFQQVAAHSDHWELAWKWARAAGWLRRYTAAKSSDDFDAQISNKESRLLHLTGELAAAKAWKSCLAGLRNNQLRQSNLVAWLQAVENIGRGTGPNAEFYRRSARRYLQASRTAIPAWIMPIHLVAEQVAVEPEIFDVAIVDEASQTGPEGLLIYFLAKQVIVVGDDKQISPSRGFIDSASVRALMQTHLAGVPFGDMLLPSSSLFHQTAIRFGNQITLREHFRCMPEIIRFSNDLCYSDTPLIPLRQYPPNRLAPIMARFVSDGFREGTSERAVNRQEAAAIACQVKDCLNDPRYAGKSIGIISLQGSEQAKLIQSILLAQVGPEPFADPKIRLRCGDPYNFQGDERDIVFLSMVASAEGTVSVTSLSGPQYEQRYNVAASRARDQLWLFHSVREGDLSTSCMRRRLIQYCYGEQPTIPPGDLARCDSQFERDVGTMLAARGVRIQPQFPVAGYRIDFVAEGRIAIECDGDAFHGPERYDADMSRQRMLERCGWKFVRIRGSEFYADRAGAIDRIMRALNRLGYDPTAQTAGGMPRSTSGEVSGNECLARLAASAPDAIGDIPAAFIASDSERNDNEIDDIISDASQQPMCAPDVGGSGSSRRSQSPVAAPVLPVDQRMVGLDEESHRVLNSLRRAPMPLSRLEIADQTGLTMHFVARSVTSLIQRQLATEFAGAPLRYQAAG